MRGTFARWRFDVPCVGIMVPLSALASHSLPRAFGNLWLRQSVLDIAVVIDTILSSSSFVSGDYSRYQ